MTRRAVLVIMSLIAGFVVFGPVAPVHVGAVAAVATPIDAAHLPSATNRTPAAHPVQHLGHLGKPLDGVQPAVHVPPQPVVRADVVDPTHLAPEGLSQVPLGERAPPRTSR
ncbi:hypothetical protein JOF41_000243 [Saccharothrix coeruleofusca]|uniref:hypothetical protein n=1 Tax=Saccharothrix coeruleofusca TaxID=33919 RepID=UPI001AE7A7AC|nr:hypothetical protein [Saccharothrix coeruleofusca]MBP2334065.1 hypothetical protein [Saccharothrix coeruleofusca]